MVAGFSQDDISFPTNRGERGPIGPFIQRVGVVGGYEAPRYDERFDDISFWYSGLDALQVEGVQVDVEQSVQNHVEPFDVHLSEINIPGSCGVGYLMAREYERSGHRVVRAVIGFFAKFVESYGHAAEVVGEGESNRLLWRRVEKITQVIKSELVFCSESYLHCR